MNEDASDAKTGSSQTISLDQFLDMELVVARVESAEKIENSKKLMRIKVILGDEPRQVVAGVAEHYSAEDLLGRKVVVVKNLKPAKLMGELSQGMLLAADVNGRPHVIFAPEEAPPGARVR
jgi:methionyl-tRNA synthetase